MVSNARKGGVIEQSQFEMPKLGQDVRFKHLKAVERQLPEGGTTSRLGLLYWLLLT